MRKTLAAATTVYMTSVLAGQASPFGPPTLLNTSPNQILIACGDLDDDGDVDLVTTEPDWCSVQYASGHDIVWYPNDGSGGLAAVNSMPYQASFCSLLPANGLVVADLDMDGGSDVVASGYEDGAIRIYRSAGVGGGGSIQVIQNTWLVYEPVNLKGLHVCDLDGDGDLDILYSVTWGSTLVPSGIMWLENHLAAGFGGPQLITGGIFFFDAYQDLACADVDLDGRVDILACRWGGQLHLIRQTSAGVFASPTVVGSAAQVLAADLDGDGDKDLVTRGASGLSAIENLDAALLAPPTPIASPPGALRKLVSCDIDGNPVPDIVCLTDAGNYAYLGDGTLTLGNPILVTSTPATDAAVGDLDNDGDNDFVWVDGAQINAQDNLLVSSYGAGCGAPPLEFLSRSTANISGTITAEIRNNWTALTFVAIGASNAFTAGGGALPLDLTALGMPNCMLYQSADILGLPTAPGASLFSREFALSIPPSTPLIGLHIYGQAYSWSPGISARPFVWSNGLDWTIRN
jgi:hypothetical protein